MADYCKLNTALMFVPVGWLKTKKETTKKIRKLYSTPVSWLKQQPVCPYHSIILLYGMLDIKSLQYAVI